MPLVTRGFTVVANANAMQLVLPATPRRRFLAVVNEGTGSMRLGDRSSGILLTEGAGIAIDPPGCESEFWVRGISSATPQIGFTEVLDTSPELKPEDQQPWLEDVPLRREPDTLSDPAPLPDPGAL